MRLNSADIAVVVIYILVIFGIALRANVYMRRHALSRKDGNGPMENHYLAGKSLTFWEITLSIIATEFSALAFLTIPTYVYFDNLSFLRFIIGACISRALIARYFIPRVYDKGLTIFEALARGIHGYANLRPEGILGKKFFSIFYVFTKLVGVGVKLLGGAILVAEFFDLSLFMAIMLISMMTYLYIILGGLKAVVRTDIMQAAIFVFGGVMAHYVIGEMSTFTWGELFTFGWDSGKFGLFTADIGIMSFFYGMVAGVAYDAATHGVDQDLTQKLFAAKDLKTAQKALAWSALGSFIVNLLFLSLGVVLWAYYTKHGQKLPQAEKIFSSLIENHFPSPIKGLMVASILAACMSSLDSAINALSAVFWNDFMGATRSKLFRLYINIDNFIITISVVIVAYLMSLVSGGAKFGAYFAYLSTTPLLAFFVCRMLLGRYIFISYAPGLIVMSILACFLGMGLNQFTFGFNPQLTILWGIVFTIFFMWVYGKVTDLFSEKNER